LSADGWLTGGALIPRVAVEIEVEDPGRFRGLPSQREARAGYLDGNREYDPDIGLTDWTDVEEAIAFERSLLSNARDASDSREFNELMDGETDDWDPLQGLDGGVAAAVFALNAAGCVTSMSCRGHPGYATEGFDIPRIRVFADAAQGAILAAAVRDAGCGLEIDERGTGLIYAPSVVEMIALAEVLLGRRAAFPVSRRRRA